MHQYKKVAKLSGLFVLCVAAVVFLYSRMHVEYSAQPEGEGEISQAAEQNHSGNKPVEFPKVYQKEVSDKLTFDVEVVVPEGFTKTNITKATAFLVDVNQEKIYDYFMGDSNSVEKFDYEGDRDAGGNNLTKHASEDTEGRMLTTSNRTVSFFMDNPSVYVWNIFIPFLNTDQYNADKFSTSENLEFQSREQGWEKLKDTAESLEIDMTNAIPYRVFSLDMETLMAEEEKLVEVYGCMKPEERNPAWSDEAEGYRYYIGQQHQGLPIYEDTVVFVNDWEKYWLNAPLWVYQTKNGLVEFKLERWFRIQEQEAVYSLIEFERVMENLEEKYSGTVHTNPLTVEQARLCEFPVQTGKNEFELTPVWICTLAEELPAEMGEAYFQLLCGGWGAAVLVPSDSEREL